MKQIVVPFHPENSSMTHLSGQSRTGSSEPQGATKPPGALPFSSVITRTQSLGPHSHVARTSTGSGHPTGDNKSKEYEGADSEQGSGALGAISVSGLQEPSITTQSHTYLSALPDIRAQKGSSLPTVVHTVGSENTLPQFPSGHSSDDQLRFIKAVPSQSEVSGTRVSRDELLQLMSVRGTTMTPQRGDLPASFVPAPTGPSLESQILAGGTPLSQPLLGSYVTSMPSSRGERTIQGENGKSARIASPITLLDSERILKSEVSSFSQHPGDSEAQEFGKDRGTASRGDLVWSSSRTSHLSTPNGTAGAFTDGLGEGKGGEFGVLSRHGTVSERPLALPSSLPQRLQMDVTLADDSRVQIDVAVQQRQVSAHLLTDQTVMRNLAVQHEGQLVGQLADAGLELKDFEASVSDHSDSLHRESRDELQESPDEQDFPDPLHENVPREFVLGLRDRGMHFVA